MSNRPKSAVREVLESVHLLKKKDKKPDPIALARQAYDTRKAELQQEIAALPRQARRHELGLLLETADKALGKDARKPNFDAANAALDNVDGAIAEEARRLEKAARGTPLEELKRKLAGEVDNMMSGERSLKAMPMFAAARKELRLRLPATIQKSDQLLADFDRGLSASRQSLKDLLATDGPKAEVSLEAFTANVRPLIDGVRARVVTFEKQLKALREEPSVKPEDQWTFYQQNKNEPDVARASLRSDQVVQDIPRLTAALDKLSKRLKALQAERASEPSMAGKKALEAEFNELSAQKKALGARLAQLNAYHSGEDARFNELILNREKAAGVGANADAMLQAVGRPDDAVFNGLKAVASEPGFSAFDAESLRAQDERLRAQFTRSLQRVIRTDRIYPSEPEVTEISAKEHTALIKLLDASRGLAANGNLPLATAAQKDALKLWTDFIVGRKHALPNVPEAPLEPADLFSGRLKRLEPRVLDLVARGHAGAKVFVDARLELVANVQAEALKEHYGWAQIRLEVDDLEQRLAKAEGELPQARVTRTSRTAKASSDKVNAALLKMYRTEKVSDPSKIEDPTRDWGDAGPPKDLVPLEQVITVGEGDEIEYYRIRTRESGGKDVDRRENKDVPREMMAHLRSRAETLALMATTLATGCEDDITAYAAETEALLGAVSSKEGQAAYEQIAEILKEIDAWLIVRPLDKYVPDGLTEAKRDLAAFKKDHLTQMPAAALGGAKKLQVLFTQLRNNAEQLRTQYHRLGERITGVHLELSSILTDSGMGVGDEIGARMGRLFNGEAVKLAKKVPSLDPAILQRIQAAQKKMQGQVEARSAGANNLEGQWRQQLEEAWRMKEGLSQTAITTADAMVDKIVKEIRAFHDKLDGMDKMAEADLVAFLLDIAVRMEDGANGAEANTKLDVDWEKLRKDVKDRLKLIEKEDVSKRTNAEELKGRLKGLKARVEATEKQVEKFLDRQWGIEQMAALIRQAEQLLVDATGDPSKKTQEISKITSKDRAEAVGTMLQRLAAAAAAAADLIDSRTKDDPGQVTAYSRQIAAAKQALRNVKGLPEAATLVSLCTQIDAKRGDADHEAKLKRRESALAELNRLRRAIEAHPAVAVYRGNPFDAGRVYPLLMGAFHRAEVGILVSVDPHAA